MQLSGAVLFGSAYLLEHGWGDLRVNRKSAFRPGWGLAETAASENAGRHWVKTSILLNIKQVRSTKYLQAII